MRRLLTWATAAVLPALFASALLIGCGGNDKKDEGAKDGGSKKEGDKKDAKEKSKKGKKEELASTGWGTVKGRITLEGAKPDTAALDKGVNELVDKSTDKAACLDAPAEQKGEQVWRIGQNNGVQDVFVWLAPPDNNHYFKIDWDKKPWRKEVEINQPHCAFTPHATVLFPSAYDPDNKDGKPSGQKFVVKNDAKFNHNTKWSGGDANPGDNKTIPAGGKLDIDLVPSPEPVILKCNIHTWMNGVVRVFDHPYATVTDKDGNYEIKDAPAGVDLNIVVWHEEASYGNKGKDGDKVKIEAGKDNVHDYTVKAK
jgi:hypothetical protein